MKEYIFLKSGFNNKTIFFNLRILLKDELIYHKYASVSLDNEAFCIRIIRVSLNRYATRVRDRDMIQQIFRIVRVNSNNKLFHFWSEM